jgi:Subtilase family/Secretion system C-terminal sorting domain/SprB repeat
MHRANRFIYLILGLLYSCVATSQDIDAQVIPSQLIIQAQPNANIEEIIPSNGSISQLICLSQSMNIWLVKTSTATITVELLASLRYNPLVKLIQYNHRVEHRSSIPSDSYFLTKQWNLLDSTHLAYNRADVSATQAWQINHSNLSQSGDTLVIAVIDDPVDIAHEDMHFFVNYHEIPGNGKDDDLNGYIDDYHGWNVFDNNDSVYINLPNNHANHVSGIAAAIGDNSKGIAGICWGCKVLAIAGSSSVESDVVKAYDYVIAMRRLWDQTSGAKGALIVATNSSFGINNGLPANNPIWCALYDSMGRYGIISATAGPNNNVNVETAHDIPTECPSRYMIGVTNTTQSNKLNPQAGYGVKSIDLGAPGSGIYSCFQSNGYGLETGTSMATPHVTGAVAALFANACSSWFNSYLAYPDSFSLMIKDWILASVDPLADLRGRTTSGGRLNLYHAVLDEAQYDCSNCGYAIIDSVTPVSCTGSNDGAITIHAGTNPAAYTYLWSTGATTATISQLAAGGYTVTVTAANGCQRTWSGFIPSPYPLRLSSIVVIPPTPNNVGNIIINATAGNDLVYYSVNGGPFTSDHIYIDSVAGDKHIRIINQYGCEIDTTVHFGTSSLPSISSNVGFTLAPNPSNGLTTAYIIYNQAIDAAISITDMTGRIVWQHEVYIHEGQNQVTLDLSILSSGTYLLQLTDDKHHVLTRSHVVISQ